MRTLAAGDRVRLTRDVDNFPTVFVGAGETGTIVEQDSECTWMHLDKRHSALDEWGNFLEIWHWDASDPPLESIGEAPSPYLNGSVWL